MALWAKERKLKPNATRGCGLCKAALQRLKSLGLRLSLPCNCASAKAAKPNGPDTHISSCNWAPLRFKASPAGTSPMICMLMVSGPRVVSPPMRSTPNVSAPANRPRENSPSQA